MFTLFGIIVKFFAGDNFMIGFFLKKRLDTWEIVLYNNFKNTKENDNGNVSGK
jgi:hypothetical protein